MSLNCQLRVRYDTAFEHDRSWLVYRDFFVTQARIVIGDSTIAIDNWLLTFARIDLLDVYAQVFVQFLLLFLPEELFVY